MEVQNMNSIMQALPVTKRICQPITIESEDINNKKKSKRCSFIGCKKKLKLTDVTCKCSFTFCVHHRLPESHKCTYDYVAEGKNKLKNQLTKVSHNKIDKI